MVQRIASVSEALVTQFGLLVKPGVGMDVTLADGSQVLAVAGLPGTFWLFALHVAKRCIVKHCCGMPCSPTVES